MLISSVWRDSARVYFILGLLLGGALVGSVLATAGSLLFGWWVSSGALPWVAVSAFAVSLLIDLRVLPIPVPQNGRQVPERVQLRGPKYGALQFGVEMGTGLRTFMTSALPHAIAVCALVALPASVALLAGVGFGAGRSIVPLARAIPGNDPKWTEAFDNAAGTVRTVIGLALVLGSVWLVL